LQEIQQLSELIEPPTKPASALSYTELNQRGKDIVKDAIE